MGCQKKIAREIHSAGADYLLTLKANHGTLHAEVSALFADPAALAYGQSKGNVVSLHDDGPEKGHGRIEQRGPSGLLTTSIGSSQLNANIGWVCAAW